MSVFTRLATIATVAAALAAPAAASADSVIAQPGVITAPCSEVRDTDSTYNVRLCGVTDIDQFRSGLAGNGNAHCGPASLYNVMQYIGKQVGAPLQNAFGDKITEYNPHNPSHYLNVTDQLWQLGEDVGWLETGGTSAAANRSTYMDYASYSDDTGWSYATGGVDTRTTADFGYELAKRLRHAPVQLWYGRYAPTGVGANLKRDGGHGITIVSAKGTAGSREVELTAMDPGRAPDHNVGNYLDTQSPATLETIKLKKVSFVEHVSDPVKKTVTLRTVTRWQVSGPNYDPANPVKAMAETFSWYNAAPPVG
jgi:hypothetical protein